MGVQVFGSEKEAASAAELDRKVILITGGTSGLGASSTKTLARLNPERIYISGRNAEAAERVASYCRQAGSTTDVRFLKCDLADLASVKAAAEYVLSQESRLDILLANAGIAAQPASVTADGYEIQFGVNHLGHALLIRKLLPLMQRTAALPDGSPRIAILTSKAYEIAAEIRFKSLKSDQDFFYFGMARWFRYQQSKLANVIYASELAQKYPEVTTISLNPGFIATEMVKNMSAFDWLCTYLMSGLKFMTPEQGGMSHVWVATAPNKHIQSGCVYEPVGKQGKLSKLAKDEGLARKLWDWTEAEIEKWL